MAHAPLSPWKTIGTWMETGLSSLLPVPWMHDLRSPFALAPAWMKRWVKWDYLGAPLRRAMGWGRDCVQDRALALQLAKSGASPWYVHDGEAAPTNLQQSVSLGWADVAEALLANDVHWLWRTRWGAKVRRMHLASLWLAVDNEEVESFLWRHVPLDQIDLELLGGARATYRVACGLGERGLLRSFSCLYDLLPENYRNAMAHGVDMTRWSLDGTLFMVERHPELLACMVDEKRPLVHLLAITPKGQVLLRRLGCAIPPDEAGNSALLTWCVASFVWKEGAVTHASSGVPFSTMAYLPDNAAYAWDSLAGLMSLGVDPDQLNAMGLSAVEQASMEDDIFIWSGMRRSHRNAREMRLEILRSYLQSRKLRQATAETPSSGKVNRL